jgi:hypothetical protein
MLNVFITNTADHPARPKYGNYEVIVMLNHVALARGTVKNHRRSRGWRNLLRMVAASKTVGKP